MSVLDRHYKGALQNNFRGITYCTRMLRVQ